MVFRFRCGGCGKLTKHIELPRCSTCGDSDLCERIEFDELTALARNLARNLAVAAGHCLSYELGANPPDTEPAKRIRLRTGIAVIPAAVWRPGCGREAPGWRGE